MSIRSRVADGVAVLSLEGPFITTSMAARSLPGHVRNQLKQGCLVVLINMAGVTDIDARGIGWLLSSRAALERHGGMLALVAPSACMRRLLALTRVDSVLLTYRSEHEALMRHRPIVVPTVLHDRGADYGWHSTRAWRYKSPAPGSKTRSPRVAVPALLHT